MERMYILNIKQKKTDPDVLSGFRMMEKRIKSFKKGTAAVLCLTMIAVLICGCEKNGEENGPVIGVTVVRKAFLQEHPNAVEEFLTAHARSTEDMVSDPETGGELCVEYGIVGKAAIARKAIPHCGISCITGEAMKEALESYLTVLYEFGKESVGGALPGEDFYYLP